MKKDGEWEDSWPDTPIKGSIKQTKKEQEESKKAENKIKRKYGSQFYMEHRLMLHICEKCGKENFFFKPACDCGESFIEDINTQYEYYKSRNGKIQIDNLNIQNYMDNVIKFWQIQPFFYDKSGMFWFWQNDKCCYEYVDDIDVMNSLDAKLKFKGETVNSKLKTHYIEAFKRYGRLKIPKDAPIKWIQFKDKAYSIKSGEIYNVTPEYFFTNPIPFEIGDSIDTPTMDKLFKEWVGEKYVNDLYNIIAYCCYRDYPIQTIFCMHGSGRNGKSQYIKIMNKFLGNENIGSAELDRLSNPNNRFESFKLYKKLMCSMGETNFGTLSSTSMLKKLVGGDLIDFEVKNKNPFNEYNYAKVIISSNSLPGTNDSSDGFMRRWFIIDFPNEFPEGKDIISTIPEIEYNNLAKKICLMLPILIENGKFVNQGSIEERKLKYMMASNPLPLFLEECCDREDGLFISYNQLYTEYVTYLNNHKKRRVSRKEFKMALEDEGFWIIRTTKKVKDENEEMVARSDLWIEGLNVKNVKMYKISINSSHIGANCDSTTFLHFLHFSSDKENYTKVLKTIETYEKLHKKENDGLIPIQEIQNTVKFEIDPIIEKLKEYGLFFEPKPGYIKRL